MENPSKKRALWVGVIVLGLVAFAYFFFQKKEIPEAPVEKIPEVEIVPKGEVNGKSVEGR
ncbi:MAG: hypothetical protein QG585_319, partial [Patescibacteria group bacterium]|nr:hypothetical protein [Patescibacteria group bacterium]